MKQTGRKITRHEAIFLPIYSILSLLSHAVSLCPRLILGDKIDKLQTVIEGYLDGVVAFCTHNTDKSCVGRRHDLTCIQVNGLYHENMTPERFDALVEELRRVEGGADA